VLSASLGGGGEAGDSTSASGGVEVASKKKSPSGQGQQQKEGILLAISAKEVDALLAAHRKLLPALKVVINLLSSDDKSD
jgi:hypothetical protein